jgi:hypothetical protein
MFVRGGREGGVINSMLTVGEKCDANDSYAEKK